MRKKIFIAIYTTCIVLALVFVNFVVTNVKKTPANKPTQAEVSDTSIAQYQERANGNSLVSVRGYSNPLYPVLFPNNEPLPAGCLLKFSLVPEKKAVDPGAEIKYSLTISNFGADTCENVSLSIYYTEKEHFVSATPAPSASDYYWNLGSLNSRASYNISLVTRNTGVTGDEILSEGCATSDSSSDICAQTVIFIQSGASSSPTFSEKISKINTPSIIGTIWGQFFSKKEFGIWVWDSPVKITSAYAQQIIGVSKKNGFNSIYITIDDFIPIAQQNNTSNSIILKDRYMKALSTFIEASNSSGISVDVVGGAKDWAKPSNRWKGYALIEFVREYNTQYPNAKIRNLQYDVEPYLLSDYDSNKGATLKEFIEFIDESARRMQTVDAGLSVVIPHFYDNKQKWTPSLSYKGRNGHAFTQLLNVLAQKDRTTIIIMSYRNFFNDQDGTKDISEPEIVEAGNSNYKTKIVIAQETGDVPPAYVTFHNYPKSSLLLQLNEINDYFGKYKNFGGVAVHYFDAFLELE